MVALEATRRLQDSRPIRWLAYDHCTKPRPQPRASRDSTRYRCRIRDRCGPGPDSGKGRRSIRNSRNGWEGALRRLSEVQREIVLLHDLEGWRHREIAEHLGIPSGTVRSHLHFARNRPCGGTRIWHKSPPKVKTHGEYHERGENRMTSDARKGRFGPQGGGDGAPGQDHHLAILDPGLDDPGYWFRFQSLVMARAGPMNYRGAVSQCRRGGLGLPSSHGLEQLFTRRRSRRR